MSDNAFSWDDVYEEIAAENAAAFDATQTPDRITAAEAKKLAEHERGVRLISVLPSKSKRSRPPA